MKDPGGSEPAAAFLAPAPDGPLERGSAPSFSVVIAAYQAATTIAETVASALDQTVPPLEVIVCDDGSTDELEEALEPFRDRIVLLRQSNRGAASARNRCVQAASGDFVACLDSDDVWLPDYVRRLGELAAARPDLDLLSTDVHFEEEREVVGRFYDAISFDVADQRKAIFKTCFVGWPAARRTRLVGVGGFDESLAIAYDWDAWARLIVSGSKAGLVPEALARYRLRPGSLASDIPRSLRERVVLLDKLERFPSLRPDERPALAAARRLAHERALFAEALEALLLARPDARRLSTGLLGARSLGFRRRLVGLAGAAMPRLTGALLGRRGARRRFQRSPTASR
ncbi:MAG TPA: glycosyltransferase family 2 protein [Gaiellaceae bacterium]|nr:glycosyltransferase family 2 protein [Gaiellaceae bacterium]